MEKNRPLEGLENKMISTEGLLPKPAINHGEHGENL